MVRLALETASRTLAKIVGRRTIRFDGKEEGREGEKEDGREEGREEGTRMGAWGSRRQSTNAMPLTYPLKHKVLQGGKSRSELWPKRVRGLVIQALKSKWGWSG